MALIAKEPLYIGFTCAAQPGNVVSPEAVVRYGWEDKVEDDGSKLPTPDANEGAEEENSTTSRKRK